MILKSEVPGLARAQGSGPRAQKSKSEGRSGAVKDPIASSLRDPFSGPEMHTGHQTLSARGRLSDRGDPVAFRCCYTALKGQHTLAWGNAPGKPDHENQSPEGATHGRLLKRWRGSRHVVNAVVSACHTCGYSAPLQGSGFVRCLPGALPQANLCCPAGAKSTAWRASYNQQLTSWVHEEARAAPSAFEDVAQHGAGRGNPVALQERQTLDCRSRLGSFAMTKCGIAPPGRPCSSLELELATGTASWIAAVAWARSQ